MSTKQIDMTPRLPGREAEFREFCRDLARRLRQGAYDDRSEFLKEERLKLPFKNTSSMRTQQLNMVFAQSVIIDLLLQDWQLRLGRNNNIVLEYQIPNENDLLLEKERVRRRHLLARDSQLSEPNVKEFIDRMERKRLTARGWHSIFSLMRDGRSLATSLREIRTVPEGNSRIEGLQQIINPYIQFVEPDVVCPHTGLALYDIWRYFRYTWVSEYKSLPGRSMSILIRDAAAPNHPVIAIAALGSSVAQQGVRDRWIGWESEAFADKIMNAPTGEDAQWLFENLQELLKDVYLTDLLKEGLVTRKDLKHPTIDAVHKLQKAGAKFRKLHTDFPNKSKFSTSQEPVWKERTRAYLFKSKRCLLVADVLQILLTFQNNGLAKPTKKNLKEAVLAPTVRRSISKLIRRVKARRVGIDMMDIIICGAIAPYNHLLGGKLVCMLLTSPEVVKHYNERYGDSASLIASAMKGKRVVRKPNLVLLGTTSLYGVGSSQYNRIKIPAGEVGGESGEVEYKNLGTSEGFGSFHFSSRTLTYANVLAGRRDGGKQVNSIFGEGANPLMRKIRGAFESIRLPSEPILMHGNKRVVYGIALAVNFREILMGFDKRPRYYYSMTKPREATAQIAKYWTKRWLQNRINNDEVLNAVEEHTLSYPITHGARVPIVVKTVDLFSELV